MTSHPLGVDSSEHELIIGNSFSKNGNTAFHSMRYDFKPASVDTSRPGVIEVGENSDVSVTVPHITSANKSQMYTVYKGNKRPVQKDCVLIIDHETGDITLEKLSYNVALKKTRAERTTPLVAPPTQPARITSDLKTLKKKKTVKKDKEEKTKKDNTKDIKDSKPLPKSSSAAVIASSPFETIDTSPCPSAATPEPMYDFGSGSSDDESPAPLMTSNGNKSDEKKYGEETVSHNGPSNDYMSTLTEDLLLSESGSDSD